jgi:hypothetical protein
VIDPRAERLIEADADAGEDAAADEVEQPERDMAPVSMSTLFISLRSPVATKAPRHEASAAASSERSREKGFFRRRGTAWCS